MINYKKDVRLCESCKQVGDSGKNIWPWTSGVDANLYTGCTFPSLSIVIPSFNQCAYIEETILSVIKQNYPRLELIIIDGDSTDESVNIIKKYVNHISYWISEKDEGQSDAINKGFKHATGDYIAWMNADDIYYENAFQSIFSMPGIENFDFIYGPVCTGSISTETSCVNSKQNRELSVFNLLHFFYSTDYMIPSQSVFVRRDFLKKNNIQYLDTNCHYCMDMEWYCRIALDAPEYFKYNQPLSFFRINDFTKTSTHYNKMQQEAVQIFLDYRNYLSKPEQAIMFNLLFLHRVIHKIYRHSFKANFFQLLKVLFKAPVVSIKDRRFLGLLKKSFFKAV